MSYPIIIADLPWDAPVEDLKTLLMAEVPAQDCVLLMWRDRTKVPQAYEVISAWGFKPSCELVLMDGLGDCRVAVLAKRGSPKIKHHRASTVLQGTKVDALKMIQGLYDGEVFDMAVV